MKQGIQSRLLWLTLLILSAGLSLTGLVLDRSHRASVITGSEEQLRLIIYSLMGSVPEIGDRMDLSSTMLEPRLTQPDSGLYAAIHSNGDTILWLSPSAQATELGFPYADPRLAPGEFDFQQLDHLKEPLFVLSYAVIWEGLDDQVLTFSVATNQRPFRLAIAGFRRSLYLGMVLVLVLFLFAQFLAVRWGLRPLRTMADEVHLLELGELERLSGNYPIELQSLGRNLGHFIDHEQRSRSRYRKAMEDLAHSLKTPLSVIRNGLSQTSDGPAIPERSLMLEQLERMETTVGYQLSRAAASGPTPIAQRVNLAAIVDRLLRALQTAYRERAIDVEVNIPSQLNVRVDERDLMEIIGNLLENAFKYTRDQIRIGIASSDAAALIVVLVIEDNGSGIEASLRQAVLDRGTRADQVQKGQGIGLAMVAELVALYRGSLQIEDSPLGGARISVELTR